MVFELKGDLFDLLGCSERVPSLQEQLPSFLISATIFNLPLKILDGPLDKVGLSGS
jgi:hypothetical protein